MKKTQLTSNEEYLSALDTIRKYHKEQKEILKSKLPALKKDLDAFFKNTYIKEYYFGDSDEDDFTRIVIFPTEPEFDEDYNGALDDDLSKVGLKHGLDVVFTSDIYGK